MKKIFVHLQWALCNVRNRRRTSGVWLVKLSGGGAIQWQKALGGNNNENANSIQLMADGKYIVAGQTDSNNGNVSDNHGGSDAWVIKLKL